MDLKFLDFEQPIAELEAKIEELRFVGDDSEININEEVARLKGKSATLTKLQFTLEEPYQRRTADGMLTLAAYRDLGGVEGSLETRRNRFQGPS